MSQKIVYIIHGWDGSPREPMCEWLRSRLIQENHKAWALSMPNSEKPELDKWVNKLNESIEDLDQNTILVGHSIGCLTILYYLAGLHPSKKIGGAVLIAPWVTLTGLDSDEASIVKSWTENLPGYTEVAKHVPKITAIFSDNDEFVPRDNWEYFQKTFGTENIIEEGKGHFTEEDGVLEIPSALEAILKM